MHPQNAPVLPSLSAASDQLALEALREAHALFNRTLACWASDLLEVQRRGLDQPTWASAAARWRRAA